MKKNKSDRSTKQLIVTIIFIIYWLFILSGPLRKWVIPEAQSILFFIRIPLTILLYLLAIQKNAWPKNYKPLVITYLLSSIGLALIPIQFMIYGYESKYLILAGYGWINYFFYIPMVFIIKENFSRDNVKNFLFQTMVMVIIEFPLVLMQFNSPSDSIINTGISADVENQFQSMGAAIGRVRPNGFFTNSAGQSYFISISFVAIIYIWFQTYKRTVIERIILLMATVSLFIIIAVSGSRSALLLIVIVMAVMVFAGLLTGRRKLIINIIGILFVCLFSVFVLWPILLPDGYETFIARWIMANESEASTFKLSFVGRILFSFYAWIYYLDAPVFGYLLGIANNAATRLSWVLLPEIAYEWKGYGAWAIESYWGVHFVELGLILGSFYILFRIWFTIWIFKRVYYVAKYQFDPLSLLIFSFAGFQLLQGLITVQGDASGFTWLFLGLSLVSNSKSIKETLKRI